MKENYIAIFDSGIGGLTVLNDLSRYMPYQNFIYIGDNKNTPYGNLSDEKLLRLSMDCLSVLNGYNVKAVILGCNTLSVSIRARLQQYFNCPVFGVFPPVETAIVKKERVLLLATPRTIERYSSYENLTKLALPYLAKDIEENVMQLNKISFKNHLPQKFLDNHTFNRVILGCTHYNFIKNQISDHFCPAKIDFGNHFTSNFVSNFFKNKKTLENCYKNSILFLGENACKNEKIYFQVVKKF